MQKQKAKWVLADALLLITDSKMQACVCHSGGRASCELDAQQLNSQTFV